MGANLRQVVFNYVRAAQKNGAEAGDQSWLDGLLASAVDDMSDGYATNTSPVAPWRAEVRMLLLGLEQNTTQRVPIEFPWPVIVVGMRPVVRPVLPVGALTVPTVDDIDVAMDVNQTTQLNLSQGVTAPAGATFLTLGSIGVQQNVLQGMALKDPRPSLGFQCRWTQLAPAAGPALFTDAFIKITCYYIPMYPQESSNVAPSLRNAP